MTKKEYARIHWWLRKNYGRPQKCESLTCIGVSKNYDWALAKGKNHSKERENYKRLCRVCHAKEVKYRQVCQKVMRLEKKLRKRNELRIKNTVPLVNVNRLRNGLNRQE